MTWLKKVLVGCSALVAIGVLGIASLWGYVYFKQARYDKEVVPYLETFMRDLAWWDPKMIAPYWAPEIEKATDPEVMKRMFGAYQRLGSLDFYEPPPFVQVGTHTSIPYPEYVTYQVSAKYSAGPALLTLQLVKVKGQLRLWLLHISSDAFLPEAPPEPPKPQVSTS